MIDVDKRKSKKYYEKLISARKRAIIQKQNEIELLEEDIKYLEKKKEMVSNGYIKK